MCATVGRLSAVLAVVALFMLAAAGEVMAWGSEAAGDPLEDANRFAALLQSTAYRPSDQELTAGYLAPGTAALRAFAEGRMGSGASLAQAIQVLRPDYRLAVRRCLPAARTLQGELPEVLDATREALGLGDEAPAPKLVVLFGEGRSAGTVVGDSVVLALEVICRFDAPEEDPVALLRGFLVHEAVHFHQLRWQRPGLEDSLLRQAMLEGYADLVTEQVLGAPTPPARERASYGSLHEVRLWRAFRRDMRGGSLAPWMYGPGRPGEPPDLGYWLGLRISEALLEKSGPAPATRRDLLRLEDPFELLERSAYGEDFGSP